MITPAEQRRAAVSFVEYWKNTSYNEIQGDQKFWNSLLREVYGIKDTESFIEYQYPVSIGRNSTGRIDGYIKETGVLIEHKAPNINLFDPEQRNGELITPAKQAYRYGDALNHTPGEEEPRYIITCNYKEFHIYNFHNQHEYSQPEIIKLEDLPEEFSRMQFLVDNNKECESKELQVSNDVGLIIRDLKNAISERYENIDNDKDEQRSLNVLCVRFVFLMYAEDAGIFSEKQFQNFFADIPANRLHRAFKDLFLILNSDKTARENNKDLKYLGDELLAFPYVNGGLFDDTNEDIIIPTFTEEIKALLLDKACKSDWRNISPTIFGAMFEDTLNPDTRHDGGMHYTSIDLIHKVIDPLFLTDLQSEFDKITAIPSIKDRRTALLGFKSKLASLKFLDPACGSGNFITESFLSLRRLENDVIRALLMSRDQRTIDSRYSVEGQLGVTTDLESVSIQQFYGIEINEFAVAVAKTALWIAEYQMYKETLQITGGEDNFLPLEKYENIKHENALHIDWNEVISSDKCTYIMGNPPFVAESKRKPEQSNDMTLIFGRGASETKLDYVICWYKKAFDYVGNYDTKIAFISTNSICQGESVPTFWKNLFQRGAEIQFAYKSFEWASKSHDEASVYCVIVGFTTKHTDSDKKLYTDRTYELVPHINPYLYASDDFWIVTRINKSLSGYPKIIKGNEPTDDRGKLFFTEKEKDLLVSKYPLLSEYIKPFIGAQEFTDNKAGEYTRFCLWCYEKDPSKLQGITELKSRFDAITKAREGSSASRINARKNVPYLFCQIRQPKESYLLVPRHTSSNYAYIPFGFFDSDIIVGDSCSIIPNIGLFEFGVLTSNIHMIWTRLVCGGLGIGIRYSPSVYNNFPWCQVDSKQKKAIESTAQGILDARTKYSDKTYSEMYSDLVLHPVLLDAHEKNDAAVMKAYGFNSKMTEEEIIDSLIQMFKAI